MNKLSAWCWFAMALGCASGACGGSGESSLPNAAPASGAGNVAGVSGGGATAPSTGPAGAGTSAPTTGGAGVPAVPVGGQSTPQAGTMAGMGGGAGLAAAGMAPGTAGSTAGATSSAGAPAAGSGGMPSSNPSQMLPAASDYSKAGPFRTMTQASQGPGNNYTIYRPEPLGMNGFVHSPLIFGPGIATSCAPGGGLNVYTSLLNHLASHGFVTICVNSLTGGPSAPANTKAMQEGLEWLIAQNSQAGIFQNKLAVDRAIAMGYSIGAGGSIQLSSHKAIMTSVIIHDHSTQGDPHGPVLVITGTEDVIAQVRMSHASMSEAPALLVALPIGHLDVPGEIGASGRYVAPITAWLRYWVNGDQDAKRYFWGDNCEMCKSPWIKPEPNEKWTAQML